MQGVHILIFKNSGAYPRRVGCDRKRRGETEEQLTMLNVTDVLISFVRDAASEHFRTLYPDGPHACLEQVVDVAGTALASIGSSDALYHNVEHTSHVTLVGLEVLKAKHLAEGSVPCEVWTNVVIALMCHDIGYVRGLCHGDTDTTMSAGADGKPFVDVSGASDAVLMPIHVNRGKRFVEERYLGEGVVDIGFVNACIERTRFPVPDEAWYQRTDDFPGLVRAADLIGQLSDPRYLHKLSAVFYEFEETGFNARMGYECPGDLLDAYPDFYERCVAPWIGDAVAFLEQTPEGRDILEHLYGNLASAQASSPRPLRDAANS